MGLSRSVRSLSDFSLARATTGLGVNFENAAKVERLTMHELPSNSAEAQRPRAEGGH